jgi:YD repeat-containing protein
VNGTTETYAYDSGDKLQSVSVGGSAVKTYGYDGAGRTTSVVSSAGTTTLTYDVEGRATSISGPGISQTNVYNGLDTPNRERHATDTRRPVPSSSDPWRRSQAVNSRNLRTLSSALRKRCLSMRP